MSPWEPGPRLLGNLYIIILGTLTTFTWKTWDPCREPWGNLEGTLREPFGNLEEPWGTLGTLGTLSETLGTLGTLGTFTWEPGNLYLGTWEPLLGNLGTFTWEPLLGTWEPWGNGFWSCSGLLRNLYYGWRPQSILLLGKKFHSFFQAHVQNALFSHVKKCEEQQNNIWKSSWEGGTLILFLQVWFFLGPVLLQLLCCLPNFCRLKIGEGQFKCIGSGLRRSQICLIYPYQNSDYQEQKHKIKRKREQSFKFVLKNAFLHFLEYSFPHVKNNAFLNTHICSPLFHIFSSNY